MAELKPFSHIKSIPEIDWCFQEELIEIVGDIDKIRELTPRQVMRHKMQWQFGDPDWWDIIKGWAEKARYEIKPK